MENTFDSVAPLFDKIEDYGRTNFELYKLKTIKKSAQVVSTLVSRGIIVFVFLLFILFSSIGMSLWAGELLGANYLGFLCVAAFYFVLGSIFYFLLHKFITRKISNSIILSTLN